MGAGMRFAKTMPATAERFRRRFPNPQRQNPLMKTSRTLFPFPAIMLLSAMLPVLASLAVAQTVDTSTGEVGNSSASASTPPPENPAPTRLVARLVPAGPDFKAQGELSFTMAGLNVSGRIEGLEPNTRYQLTIHPAVPALGPAAAQPPGNTENPPPAAGTPAAGEPNAGGPDAGRPQAGQPDGTDRPGPGGGGTQGTGVSGTRAPSGADARQSAADITKTSGVLGILTADAKGGANVNLTVRSMVLTTGPDGLQGRAAILTTVPPAAGTAPVIVATGMIVIPGKDDAKN
jgi:hypothetical protein